MKRALVISAVVIALMSPSALYAVGRGDRAPELSFKSLKGKTVSLTSFRGRIIVLNFWATWCPPCKAEMPVLNRIYRDYRDQGVVVVAVTVQSTPGAIKRFVEKNQLEFPILINFKGRSLRTYSVISIPVTFLIDQRGVVVERYNFWRPRGLRDRIEQLIKEN